MASRSSRSQRAKANYKNSQYKSKREASKKQYYKTRFQAYDLGGWVERILQSAMMDTMNDMLDVLRDYIMSDVYSYQGAWAEMGYRTYEFLDSWEVHQDSSGRWVIRQDLRKMPHHHGLIHMDRQELAKIIETGKGYTLSPNMEARPFWSDFQKYYRSHFREVYNIHFEKRRRDKK